MSNFINPTQMLPIFYMPRSGRKSRSAQDILVDKIAFFKQKSFEQIGEIFCRFIPGEYIIPEQSGIMSRRSIYSRENTFWAFIGQAQDAYGGCKEGETIRGVDHGN